MQNLGDTIFVCAVPLDKGFLDSIKEIVSFKFKARIYMCMKTLYLYKMLHSLVLDQQFFYKKVNQFGIKLC